jgi:acetyl esterase/lipase
MSSPIDSPSMDGHSRVQTPHANPWTVIRQFTAHDQTVMSQMRAAAAPNKGKLRGVAARPAFDGIIGQTAGPGGVSYREDSIGGVSGWWCEPSAAPADTAILHLHGGWFNWGSAEAFRHLAGHIALSAGARAFVPDYRLAPEHPFPAGANDARSCVEGILELGLRAVAVTGDSAGGNLALTLLPSQGARVGTLRCVSRTRRLPGGARPSSGRDPTLAMAGRSGNHRFGTRRSFGK